MQLTLFFFSSLNLWRNLPMPVLYMWKLNLSDPIWLINVSYFDRYTQAPGNDLRSLLMIFLSKLSRKCILYWLNGRENVNKKTCCCDVLYYCGQVDSTIDFMMIVRECAFVHTPTTHLTELGLVTKKCCFSFIIN